MGISWPTGETASERCPMCGVVATHPVFATVTADTDLPARFHARSRRWLRCATCASLFVDDRVVPPYDGPSGLVAAYYESAGLEVLFRRLFFVAPGKVHTWLDVGCGMG